MPTIQLLDFQSSPWVEAIAQMWQDNLGVSAAPDVVEIGVYVEKRNDLHPEDYTGFYVTNVAVDPQTLLTFVAGSVPAAPAGPAGINLVPPEVGEDFADALADGATPPELLEILEGKRHPEIEASIALARDALAEEDPEAQQPMLVEAAIARNEATYEIPVLWGGYNLLINPKIKNLRPWPTSSVFTTKGVTIEE